MGYVNNGNIIQLSQILTIFVAFEEIHQVIIDGISDNMASLVLSGKYCAIKPSDKTTNGYYVIKFISESYTLQNNTKIYGKNITAGELVVKVQYLCYMQESNNCYWNQHPHQYSIIAPTRIILCPCLKGFVIKMFKKSLKVCVAGFNKKIHTKTPYLYDRL